MATYADAGVDVGAGERAVELMKASISKASRPEVMGSIGGFAGLFDASALKNFRHPLLATSTDGVGTKGERHHAWNGSAEPCLQLSKS